MKEKTFAEIGGESFKKILDNIKEFEEDNKIDPFEASQALAWAANNPPKEDELLCGLNFGKEGSDKTVITMVYEGQTIVVIPDNINEVPTIIKDGVEVEGKIKISYVWNTADDSNSAYAKLIIEHCDEKGQVMTESKETIGDVKEILR